MNIFKNIIKIVCVVLAFCAIAVDCGALYYKFFVHEETLGVNYVTDQVGLDIISSDDLSEEERMQYEDRYFIHANFYDNSKENGIVLQEMQLNYFTDYTLTSDTYRATGIQKTPSTKKGNSTVEKVTNAMGSWAYYDTYDGLSWTGNFNSTKLDRSAKFIIKIGGKPYVIQLTGKYKSTFWIFKSTKKLTYAHLFNDIMQSVQTNSNGYSDGYMLMDLSQYFTISEYDASTGKVKEDDVTDIIKNYIVVKFHYDANGATSAGQSLFKRIALDSGYELGSDLKPVEYSRSEVVYSLTEKDLTYRYSEVYGCYLASLSADTMSFFNDVENYRCDVDIDMSSEYLKSKNITLGGLDYNAFSDFRINTLTLKAYNGEFLLLDNCLKGTKLNTLEHSSTLTIKKQGTPCDSEYSEVIV